VSPLSDSNDDLGSALGIVALIVDPDADPVSDSNQSADPNYRSSAQVVLRQAFGRCLVRRLSLHSGDGVFPSSV
jgi:hypothetical protein